MGDLTSRRWIVAKGIMFAVIRSVMRSGDSANLAERSRPAEVEGPDSVGRIHA